MRAAAAFLAALACVCAGAALRDTLRRRVRLWTQTALLLRQMRLRVHLREPLDVLLAQLSRDEALDALAFLPDFAARCAADMPLPQAWTGAVESFCRTFRLPRAQRTMLAQWVPSLAAADGERLDGLLELYETQAQDALREARQWESSVGALCVRIGAAAGVLLGILIL